MKKTIWTCSVAAAMALSFSALVNAQAPVSADKVQGFLNDSGFEYKARSTSAWTIKATTGNVVIGVEGDAVLIVMTVAPKGKFKISAESMSDMLKLAHSLDFLQIGIDDEGNLFVRSEAKAGTLDGAEFNANLMRVVNGQAKAAAKIAPYLTK